MEKVEGAIKRFKKENDNVQLLEMQYLSYEDSATFRYIDTKEHIEKFVSKEYDRVIHFPERKVIACYNRCG